MMSCVRQASWAWNPNIAPGFQAKNEPVFPALSPPAQIPLGVDSPLHHGIPKLVRVVELRDVGNKLGGDAGPDRRAGPLNLVPTGKHVHKGSRPYKDPALGTCTRRVSSERLESNRSRQRDSPTSLCQLLKGRQSSVSP